MPFSLISGASTTALDAHGGHLRLALTLPTLAGTPEECLLHHPLHLETQGPLIIGQAGGHVVFAAAQPRTGALDRQTRSLYTSIFRHLPGVSLLRIWNHIPAINETQAGLENYQAFCVGRAEAFDQHFAATTSPATYPAGSALGIDDEYLVIFGLGSTSPHPVHHLENPCQTPAYCYPKHLSPRPPAFSRASLGGSPTDPSLYISGTASVVGSDSEHPGALGPQLQTTRTLLDKLFQQIAQHNAAPHAGWSASADLRLYLRDATQLPAAQAWLRESFPLREGHWRIVRADICRAELEAEIEVSLHPGSLATPPLRSLSPKPPNR